MAKVVLVSIGTGPDTITVAPGTYRKEAKAGENGRVRNRDGAAYLTVEPTAVLRYTNRRGEPKDDVSDKEFLKYWNSGYDKPFRL